MIHKRCNYCKIIGHKDEMFLLIEAHFYREYNKKVWVCSKCVSERGIYECPCGKKYIKPLKTKKGKK